MAVPAVTPHDLDRVVEVLGRRREALVPHAPIFWRLAPDSDACHRAYLVHLLSEAGGARGWRSSTSVLIAAPQGPGWLVDDLAVDAQEGATDGHDLWNAFAADCAGEHVRLVCPTYEAQRAKLAVAAGLVVSESWWLRELDDSGGGSVGAPVTLPGAEAVTVGAPPVYDPPGPVLFLPAPDDAAAAVPAALERAPALGCAAVVVNQAAGRADDSAVLSDAGFRRHCDFYTGTVREV